VYVCIGPGRHGVVEIVVVANDLLVEVEVEVSDLGNSDLGSMV
jgi:hypothetical protein